MFSDEIVHNIDTKGRIIVPAKFRYELGETFWINRGLDGCLCIYPTSEWMKKSEKLEALSENSRDAREYVRQMFRLASEVTLDNQGRILISSKLITLAGLKKECVFVGANKYIELWDQERWEAHNECVESLDELAERINGTV
ncbi:MAG: division/cell wall cluster transcriptional repressor MraZ [Erysipelotrichaceae bacterium]|nr:division/cell wall cluster transcriptional repressor MraZ [Erysipelotrichaceae bacterium]